MRTKTMMARIPTMTSTHSAKVICDSISPKGSRLTTMIVTMPRIVLAEFNTHRAISKPHEPDTEAAEWFEFSRNSASSRAIPVERMIAAVEKNPYVPTTWGRNQAGMQESDEEIEDADEARADYLDGLRDALARARRQARRGCHKQLVNRGLEEYAWHTVLVSSTEWSNFFAQRCHPAAHPDIRIVAERMRDALAASEPVERTYHVPFDPGQYEEGVRVRGTNQKIRIAIARCARVSYLTHDGKHDVDADLRLYDRLRNADPPHASPFEHVAYAGE